MKRKHATKRLWSMLLCLVMVLGMMPNMMMTAHAASDAYIAVGSVKMTDGKYLHENATDVSDAASADSSVGYAYYKDGVLTLNNFDYYGLGSGGALIYVYDASLTGIVLQGTNTLTRNAIASGMETVGIDASGKDITISGSGSLEITTEGTGILAKDITISGCTLTVSTKGVGISSKSDGELSISNSSVSVNAGSDGIIADGDITISSGTVSVHAGREGVRSYWKNISISGDNVEVTAVDNTLSAKNISVTGGNVKAVNTNDTAGRAVRVTSKFTVASGLTVRAASGMTAL